MVENDERNSLSPDENTLQFTDFVSQQIDNWSKHWVLMSPLALPMKNINQSQ